MFEKSATSPDRINDEPELELPATDLETDTADVALSSGQLNTYIPENTDSVKKYNLAAQCTTNILVIYLQRDRSHHENRPGQKEVRKLTWSMPMIPIRKISERERNPKPKRSRHDSESFASAQKQLLRAQWHLERVENEVISEQYYSWEKVAPEFSGELRGFTEEDIRLLNEQDYDWEATHQFEYEF